MKNTHVNPGLDNQGSIQVKMKEQLGYSESSHWNSGSGNFARRYCHGYIWLASAKLKRSFQIGKKLLEGACDW